MNGETNKLRGFEQPRADWNELENKIEQLKTGSPQSRVDALYGIHDNFDKLIQEIETAQGK